jgi:superfamily II DNA or RNA helicase
LHALVAVPGTLESMRGVVAYAVALHLSGRASIAVDEAVGVLDAHGLPPRCNRKKLADRMFQSTRDDEHFARTSIGFRAHSQRALAAWLEWMRADLDEDEPRVAAAIEARITALRQTAASERAASPDEPESLDLFAPDRVDSRESPERSDSRKTRDRADAITAPERHASAAPTATPTAVPPARSFHPTLPSVEPLDVAALRATLSREPTQLNRLAHVLWAHAIASADQFDDLLATRQLAGIEPHRHQVEAVRRVLRVLRGRALLADEVGLGKTVEAIMVLREYQLRGMARRVLVLVPPALVAQWRGELLSKAGIAPRVAEGAELRGGADAFWRGDGVVLTSLATARHQKHAAAVQAEPWDLVVVDEAHHVKNRATLGWKLIDGIRTRFLLLVTATPLQNDLEDLYGLVTLLRPGQLPSPAAFRKEFVDRKDPTSPRNRERLRRLLSEVMVRSTRAQSGLHLPPRFVTTVLAEPLAGEAELYRRTVELLRAEAEHPTSRLATATLLLEAGSSPWAVRRTVDKMIASGSHAGAFGDALASLAGVAGEVEETRKTQLLVDIVRAHAEPVLVFSRYRATLDAIAEALAGAGVPCATFHGGMTAAEKAAAVEQFRAGTRVLAATDVGAEGQNLQFCNVLVNFDLPWNPMLVEQRIGRLHRIGQTREVRVYNLALRGTVDERVLDVLDRRLHLFELIIGEMDMVLGNLADDRDLEERILDLVATQRTEEALQQGFDTIGDEIAAARGQYDQARKLGDAVFGEDYEA